MTHLLTRLYADEKTVHTARERLHRAGFPRYQMRTISKRDGEDRDALMKRISNARVPDRAAGVYAESVASGNSLLVAVADYKPLGARKIGVKVLSEIEDMPTNLEEQDFKLAWQPEPAGSVMKEHPRFLTAEPDYNAGRSSFSELFGFGSVSTKQRRIKVGKGGPFLPMGTIKSGRKASSAMSGGKFMSRMFWPMKLLSTGARGRSVTSGGGTVFSNRLGLRTTSD